MALPPLFTVGHSNHAIEAFVALLQKHAITAIADVRSQPYSQYTPQFNRETLEAALLPKKIRYVFLGQELGARRVERECYVDGQARYERVAALPAFQEGLERIVRGAATQRIALMCSEKDPLTCHRTILVCRHLRERLAIAHILEDGSLEAQAAAETRLLGLVGLPEADLFQSREELVERAYEKQGREIAYREEPNAATAGAVPR